MSDDIKKNRFFELRFNGNNISSAACTLGVSYATAKRWNKDLESVVKSENIKKAIESSILSALSRFENYSNLLSAEFAKLQIDAQKHKSVSLYFEDRMNFLLKIIHMDRRLNNSMLKLLKMNRDLASPPPDVQSSIENLQCSMDDDNLNPDILSENAEIKSKTPDAENTFESNIEDNNDDIPDEDNIDGDNEEISDEDDNEESSDDENSDDNSNDENNDENNEDNIEDNDEETGNYDHSKGISIAEYEELQKRKTPLEEAEQIMKQESISPIRHGGSMYRPKQEDLKNSAESKPDEKSMSHYEPL